MRPNPVKARLAAGGTSYGTMAFEFFTPGLPQIAAAAGAEFAAATTWSTAAIGVETVKTQIALCRGLGLVAAGAGARDAVPLHRPRARHAGAHGRDGADGRDGASRRARSVVHALSARGPARRCVRRRRRTTTISTRPVVDEDAPRPTSARSSSASIETATGLENVDAIAAVPGVDVGWLGHFDLTNFLGIPAQFDHPRYLDAVERIVAACRRHGKTPGFMAGDCAGRASTGRSASG